MSEEELKNLTAKIYDQIVSDAEALATKYDEYRNLISEKIVALSIIKKKYDFYSMIILNHSAQTDLMSIFVCFVCTMRFFINK